MARHYGIESIRGSTFRRVPLDAASPRGGLLTQASLLLGNSTGQDSHPIKRAVWVRKRLLDDPPPPPPANVPELDSESPELVALPVSEQLRLHRQEASCASCHSDIDPWGVVFEHFDAIGQWRDQIRRLRPRREKAPEAQTETARLIGCESCPVELPSSSDACVIIPPRGDDSSKGTRRKSIPRTPSIP